MTVEVSPIVGGIITVLTDASTISWPANQGYAYQMTLGGSRTMANPSDLTVGALYMLEVIQDSTGSRLVTWGSQYKFINGTAPVLSTGGGDVDICYFFSDGTYLSLVSFAQDVAVPLAAPSSLTATTNQSGQITLHWTNNSPTATGFHILRDDGLGFDDVAQVAVVTTYVDTVAPGDYPYQVKAARNAVLSAASNTANGTSN